MIDTMTKRIILGVISAILILAIFAVGVTTYRKPMEAAVAIPTNQNSSDEVELNISSINDFHPLNISWDNCSVCAVAVEGENKTHIPATIEVYDDNGELLDTFVTKGEDDCELIPKVGDNETFNLICGAYVCGKRVYPVGEYSVRLKACKEDGECVWADEVSDWGYNSKYLQLVYEKTIVKVEF